MPSLVKRSREQKRVQDAEQSRAEKSRAEQGRAGQGSQVSRAGQGKQTKLNCSVILEKRKSHISQKRAAGKSNVMFSFMRLQDRRWAKRYFFVGSGARTDLMVFSSSTVLAIGRGLLRPGQDSVSFGLWEETKQKIQCMNFGHDCLLAIMS